MGVRILVHVIVLLLCHQFEAVRLSAFSEQRTSNDPKDGTYQYQTKKFVVPVDHFSFAVNKTFEIRYLVNDTWQEANDAPIFFYTGNEGNIDVFAQNTGFMWDIAPNFGALLIFAEHRYYGESMPFGNKSFSSLETLGYLTAQQAMADYIDLIDFLKSDPKTKGSPVIVFGGSYGGMLSAWIRIKYPHKIQGAIAASAPILQFTGITECEAFARIVTSDFRAAHPNCPKLIRKSWDILKNMVSHDEGRKWLTGNWKLCKPLNSSSHYDQLSDWLENVYGNLAMTNYPYPSNFLAPLPASPISVFCDNLKNASLSEKPLLMALYQAINVYTNYTGKASCISIEDASPQLEAKGWDYQACTEMIMPMCKDGVNDMFAPQDWDIHAYTKSCQTQFAGIKPMPYLACKEFGCSDLSWITNVVFSNGLMDPWTSGGVVRNISSSSFAVIIPEGAHHLDLRAANPKDPYSVTQARKFHQYAIRRWIKQYHLAQNVELIP